MANNLQKQLVINDEVSATTALEKVSYYGLINGYKDIFKDPATNSFYPGTTFNDIYNLYLFDAELRDLFLKYILIFEKHVKSSISYHFSNTYGNGMAFYQDTNNYDYGNNLTHIFTVDMFPYKTTEPFQRSGFKSQLPKKPVNTLLSAVYLSFLDIKTTVST